MPGELWDSTTKFFGDMWEEIKCDSPPPLPPLRVRRARGARLTPSRAAPSRSQQVPTLDTNWGTGLLIVNIFLPGVGTLVAGIKSERNTTMVIGVFQFLLAFLIVGWIWSIYWGYLLYKKVGAPCSLPAPPRGGVFHSSNAAH